ncbi:MAG: T9SS type A sorting domain-containing protein [Flavobacteriales bacterium]
MKHSLIISFFYLCGHFSFGQYALDPNFGFDENPYAFDANGTIDYWYDSTTGPDDKIYFTGWTNEPSNSLVIGSMDANGEFNLNYAPFYNRFYAPSETQSINGYEIEMQSSDLPVVGGIRIVQGASVSSLFMARFTAGGNLDASFGDLGYFFYAPEDQDCYLGEIIVSPTDEIYMLGRVREPGFGNMSHLIIKLTADGQLDESFSEDGILTFNTADSNNYLSGGLLLDNGQLLVAGKDNGPVNIYRINADGTLDGGFNGSGEIATPGLSEILAIKQYGDWFYALSTGSGASSFIYKFDENGLDGSYGIQGEVDLGYDGFTDDAWFSEDGKVYFTGTFQGSSYVVRADTSGVLDDAFFEGGLSSFEISENTIALFSTTPLNDGSLITSGHAIDLFSSGSGQDFVAYKLTENGVVDNVQEQGASAAMVYPNPFTSEITVESEQQISSIRIFDLSGKLVHEDMPSTQKFTIKHLRLNTGIYSVHIQTANGIQQVQVVKM